MWWRRRPAFVNAGILESCFGKLVFPVIGRWGADTDA